MHKFIDLVIVSNIYPNLISFLNNLISKINIVSKFILLLCDSLALIKNGKFSKNKYYKNHNFMSITPNKESMPSL